MVICSRWPKLRHRLNCTHTQSLRFSETEMLRHKDHKRSHREAMVFPRNVIRVFTFYIFMSLKKFHLPFPRHPNTMPGENAKSNMICLSVLSSSLHACFLVGSSPKDLPVYKFGGKNCRIVLK